MKFVGDFYIHLKYSKTALPKVSLEGLDKWTRTKEIKVLDVENFRRSERSPFKKNQSRLKPVF